MANYSGESPSTRLQDVREYEPRTFTRNDIILVDHSSPLEPYLSFIIGPNPLRRLIIKIWSHDQGWCDAEYMSDDPYANSHTLFALGIVPGISDQLNPPDEPYLCEIQRNVRASTEAKCHILEWRLNTPIEEDQTDEDEAQGWLESISSGSRVEVGVFPLARYSSWVNVVNRVEVELYDNNNTPLSLDTSSTASEAVTRTTRNSIDVALPIISRADIGTESTNTLTAETEEEQPILDQAPGDDPRIMERLYNLASSLVKRYYQTGLIEDLTKAIEVIQEAVEATPHDHPSLGIVLGGLADRIAERYDLTQLTDDLTRAIEVAQKSSKLIPDSHPELVMCLSNLGLWLAKRYEKTTSMDDLTGSIEAHEQAIKLIPDGHPDLSAHLNNLSIDLLLMYKHTDSAEHLMNAIKIGQKAVEAASDDHPGLVSLLDNLVQCLGESYTAKEKITDSVSAIEMLERAIERAPGSHPRLASYLNILGQWLAGSYVATGSIEHLERGIKVAQRVIEIIPDTHSSTLVRAFGRLGKWFHARSRHTNSTHDLDTAIELTERAIEIMSAKNPNLTTLYDNLGDYLVDKFQRTGSTDLLTSAIEAGQKAVESNHDNHPNITHLNSLGISFHIRHVRTGSIDDLTKAIEALERALGSVPDDHPDVSMVFGNLASCFESRHKCTGSMDDMTKAIEAAEKCIKATPDNDTSLAQGLNILANVLSKQYQLTRSMEVLTRAIEVSQQALLVADSFTLSVCLCNLGNRLNQRYIRTGSMDDLTRAIELAEKAIEAMPNDHIDLAICLGNLGDGLGRRYEETRAKTDQDAQLSAYVRAWHCTISSPAYRINLAYNAARIYTSRGEWDEAYHLLREAVLLLPKVSPRSLKQADMQRILGNTHGLATDTAAVAINAGKSASEVLSILELGRGVMAGLLIDSRGDLSDLRDTNPSLADKFIELRQELNLELPDSNSMNVDISMVNRRYHASREFDEIIDEIRAQDGFHDFLQPPSAASFMKEAVSGPIVVINFSFYRCDAILVEAEAIRLLELPGITTGDSPEFGKSNALPFLEMLWTSICLPCLDALGFTEAIGDAPWPHIWWIPTCLFSKFPLHAAGIYASGSKETVLDRVISSYALSIKSLQHVRQQRTVSGDEHAQQNAAVLVEMQETEGQMSLPNAKTEVDKVRGLCSLLGLEVLTPPSRKADILEHLKKCKILHFAGHGESKTDPSQSCLLLDDWQSNPLTVGDLRKSWLQDSPAFLAYLSACSTGSNDGLRLSDEAIHLTSAFQLAGFRHIVGTISEVSDPHCVEVAVMLYQTLCEDGMTDEAVSYGLHQAIRKLRDDSSWGGTRRDAEREDRRPEAECSLSTYWIPFVHFGA